MSLALAEPFVVLQVIMQTNDFFQEEIRRCRSQAERAENKADRDFWLRLAQRWEDLVRARQENSKNVGKKPVRRATFGHTRFVRRRAA